jgi:putative component of toxin-antitoxin plasmid stabilization module
MESPGTRLPNSTAGSKKPSKPYMDGVSETYEKWYKTMRERRFGNEISQMIASLAAYQAGEVTISDSVKEMLRELDIVDKSGKIKIKNSKNMISWLEIAIRLQTHYHTNGCRF